MKKILTLIVVFFQPIFLTNVWSGNCDGLNKKSEPEKLFKCIQDLDTRITRLKPGNLLDGVVPANAVVAFNLKKCPPGWEEYPLAYGRFIRGIDKSDSKIDPDGKRNKGSVQSDDIGLHSHSTFNNSSSGVQDGGNANYLTIVQKGTTTGGFGGSETRPKNVALLYCKKE